MNYTEEQTKSMIECYNNEPTRKTVAALSKQLERSEKSIIGKLSKEGVYQKKVYTSKNGETPITKIDLVSMISDLIGGNELLGLDKTPKGTLVEIHKRIQLIKSA